MSALMTIVRPLDVSRKLPSLLILIWDKSVKGLRDYFFLYRYVYLFSKNV